MDQRMAYGIQQYPLPRELKQHTKTPMSKNFDFLATTSFRSSFQLCRGNSMLCPSDEIRRFVLREEKSHFERTQKRSRACYSVEIPDLPLHAVRFCVRLLGCSCRSASCGVLSRFASALPLGIRFAACLAAKVHPPRRSAPPLQGWDSDQELLSTHRNRQVVPLHGLSLVIPLRT